MKMFWSGHPSSNCLLSAPLTALATDTAVAAGTAWMWSREEYFEAVDVLFVYETGQMSLANVLAVATQRRALSRSAIVNSRPA
jgi:hypothetical protein